jgi:DNA-binding MarR family transcriptional regulator
MHTRDEKLLHEDYEALADLRFSLRKFTQFSTGAAVKMGLSPREHQALLAIKGLPAEKKMTVAMLADRLLIAPQSAAELTDQMASAGYVVRTPAAGRLRHTLALSEKGESILDALTEAHLHEIREMAPILMQALRVLHDRRKMEQFAWMR